jgi:hypothetical protein
MAEQQTEPRQLGTQETPRGRRRRPMPWWKSKVVVTLLGALAAAVAPVTVGVQNYIEKQKQLAISERDQDFKMHMAYLDLAIDPARTPADRAIVLRFLKGTTHDTALAAWASNELNVVQQELARLQQDLERKQEALAAQRRAEQEAKAKVDALRKQVRPPTAQLEEAEAELIQARDKKASVQAETELLRGLVVPGATLTPEEEQGARSPPPPPPSQPLLGLDEPAAPSNARCEPGTVKARPVLRISQEVANLACEQSLQDGVAPVRRMVGLVWETRLVLGQREGSVTCVCRPAGT